MKSLTHSVIFEKLREGGWLLSGWWVDSAPEESDGGGVGGLGRGDCGGGHGGGGQEKWGTVGEEPKHKITKSLALYKTFKYSLFIWVTFWLQSMLYWMWVSEHFRLPSWPVLSFRGTKARKIFYILILQKPNLLVSRACDTRFMKIVFDSAEIFNFLTFPRILSQRLKSFLCMLSQWWN
jgi:hypothetical protein